MLEIRDLHVKFHNRDREAVGGISLTIGDGEIVVAMIDDEATVKRFFREKGRIRLQPENPAMSPIYARDVTVLGKVIANFRFY